MVFVPPVPAARVYIGLNTANANLVSGTSSGDFDENEADPPYFIPPGQYMTVEWSDVPDGGSAFARFEYHEA